MCLYGTYSTVQVGKLFPYSFRTKNVFFLKGDRLLPSLFSFASEYGIRMLQANQRDSTHTKN